MYSVRFLYCLSTCIGKWSAPVLSGHAPPPCHGFSFVKVGHSEVLLFGGRIGRKPNGSLSNQLFLLSLNDLVSFVIHVCMLVLLDKFKYVLLHSRSHACTYHTQCDYNIFFKIIVQHNHVYASNTECHAVCVCV